jgi:hypothetical protein
LRDEGSVRLVADWTIEEVEMEQWDDCTGSVYVWTGIRVDVARGDPTERWAITDTDCPTWIRAEILAELLFQIGEEV